MQLATATFSAEATVASAMLAALPGLHREQQACLSEQGSVLHLVWQIEQWQDSFCIEPRQKAPMSHQILCGLMLIEQPQSKRLKTWQLMQAAWPVLASNGDALQDIDAYTRYQVRMTLSIESVVQSVSLHLGICSICQRDTMVAST